MATPRKLVEIFEARRAARATDQPPPRPKAAEQQPRQPRRGGGLGLSPSTNFQDFAPDLEPLRRTLLARNRARIQAAQDFERVLAADPLPASRLPPLPNVSALQLPGFQVPTVADARASLCRVYGASQSAGGALSAATEAAEPWSPGPLAARSTGAIGSGRRTGPRSQPASLTSRFPQESPLSATRRSARAQGRSSLSARAFPRVEVPGRIRFPHSSFPAAADPQGLRRA